MLGQVKHQEGQITDTQCPISEDELHAYVDGLLDPGRRAEVERSLHAHPEVFRRMKAYEAQRNHLREVFAGQPEAPPASSLNLATLVEERLARRRAPWPAAAAAALALLAGGAGRWLLWGRPPNRRARPPAAASADDALPART